MVSFFAKQAFAFVCCFQINKERKVENWSRETVDTVQVELLTNTWKVNRLCRKRTHLWSEVNELNELENWNAAKEQTDLRTNWVQTQRTQPVPSWFVFQFRTHFISLVESNSVQRIWTTEVVDFGASWCSMKFFPSKFTTNHRMKHVLEQPPNTICKNFSLGKDGKLLKERIQMSRRFQAFLCEVSSFLEKKAFPGLHGHLPLSEGLCSRIQSPRGGFHNPPTRRISVSFL